MNIWARMTALERRVSDLEYEKNVPMLVEGVAGTSEGSYPIRFAVLELLTSNGYVLVPGTAPRLKKKGAK